MQAIRTSALGLLAAVVASVLAAPRPAAAADPYTLTTLASFNGANGGLPLVGLVQNARGDLFGTTVGGGAFNNGTVFELSPTAVPEPASLVVLGTGLAVVAGMAWRACERQTGVGRSDRQIGYTRMAPG